MSVAKKSNPNNIRKRMHLMRKIVGRRSTYETTMSILKVAAGTGSIWKATMAILNVAAGRGSIWEATMAILNVATGRGSIWKAIMAILNVATGRGSSWEATMAILNVATGRGSIWETTMALLNVATGRGSIWEVTMGSLNVATGKAHYLRNNYDHLERGNWQGQYLRSNYGHIKFGELQAQYLRNNYGHLERGNWQGQYLRSNYGQLERGNGQGQYLRSPSSSDYGNHASIRRQCRSGQLHAVSRFAAWPSFGPPRRTIHSVSHTCDLQRWSPRRTRPKTIPKRYEKFCLQTLHNNSGSKVCPCSYIMVSKRFVQMVFPFFAEEAKRKAELEELALSAEQDEEDVFDFGGMRWQLHSPTSHRTCVYALDMSQRFDSFGPAKVA